MCRLKSDFLSKISVKKNSQWQTNICVHQCDQEVLKYVFTVSALKSVFLCLILGISFLKNLSFGFGGCFCTFFADVITF